MTESDAIKWCRRGCTPRFLEDMLTDGATFAEIASTVSYQTGAETNFSEMRDLAFYWDVKPRRDEDDGNS
jgi:hypothetical protein